MRANNKSAPGGRALEIVHYELCIMEVVLNKSLDGFIACETQSAIKLGCLLVALERALPIEFLVVGVDERRVVHLRLVLENSIALVLELLGTHGNRHLNVVNVPLAPQATIHPNSAVLHEL